MARFYFHVCDGGGFFEDEDGAEHADLAAARASAVAGLREILAEAIQNGEMDAASFIEIENDQHDLVMVVSVEDAVRMNKDIARTPRKLPD